MKIRNDFVSNSSSSSFILGESVIFEYFNITKKDIVDALTDLIGKDYIKKYKDDIKKSRKENPQYLSEAEKKYPDDIGPFYIYDLSDEKDKKAASEMWGDLLEGWDCHMTAKSKYEEGKYTRDVEYGRYSSICEGIAKVYNLNNFDGVVKNQKDIDELTQFVRTKEKQANGCYGYDQKAPKNIGEILLDIRKKCGILTNKEVLELEFSRFFIHFDDNEIYAIKGMTEDGDADGAAYSTETYDNQRVFEILWKYWLNIGKVKSDDIEFLNENYPMDDYQKRMKEQHPDKYKDIMYSTANEKNLSFHDLWDEVLTFNGHEG